GGYVRVRRAGEGPEHVGEGGGEPVPEPGRGRRTIEGLDQGLAVLVVPEPDPGRLVVVQRVAGRRYEAEGGVPGHSLGERHGRGVTAGGDDRAVHGHLRDTASDRDGVGPWQDGAEPVIAAGGGGRGEGDREPVVMVPGQGDRDTGGGRLAEVDEPVPVEVLEHHPGHAGGIDAERLRDLRRVVVPVPG